MKPFLRIKLCFGGTATVNPAAAADDRGIRRQTTEAHDDQTSSYNNRVRVRKPSSNMTTHWRPKLHAISETNPTPEIVSGSLEKRPVKVKPKSPAKTRQPSHSDDYYYRKYSGAIAMPAFSPTPFMF